MANESSFSQLLQRLRSGDEDAVRAFVAKYEPYIRRTIRRRLARTSLQAAADSADICQSVLATFLIHVAAGSYVLNDQEHMDRLLLGMARKKLAALARHESAACRDRRRTHAIGEHSDLVAQPSEQPERQALGRDLLVSVAQRLPEHERRLFEMRQQGHEWNEIAAQVGSTPGVLRKQLSRALLRVTGEMGLDG